MKSSTALPALTNIITLRGFFKVATISFIDLAPITFVPGKKKSLVTLQSIKLYQQKQFHLVV